MLGLVTPKALRIAISLDCSIILADIEEVKEKKQRNMTMMITTVKIILIIYLRIIKEKSTSCDLSMLFL